MGVLNFPKHAHVHKLYSVNRGPCLILRVIRSFSTLSDYTHTAESARETQGLLMSDSWCKVDKKDKKNTCNHQENIIHVKPGRWHNLVSYIWFFKCSFLQSYNHRIIVTYNYNLSYLSPLFAQMQLVVVLLCCYSDQDLVSCKRGLWRQ